LKRLKFDPLNCSVEAVNVSLLKTSSLWWKDSAVLNVQNRNSYFNIVFIKLV